MSCTVYNAVKPNVS